MPGHKDWLKKALGDLKAAKLLLQDKDLFDIVAFHTHQCAEKSLKGYLMYRHIKTPKTHSLEELLVMCTREDASFTELLNDVLALDPYVISTRYPADDFAINKTEVLTAIRYAENIFNFIRKCCVCDG